MSADSDTVRAALRSLERELPALIGETIRFGDDVYAALARLEAAAEMADSNQSLMEAYRTETQLVVAQQDALAEALRQIVSQESSSATYLPAFVIARAALAEAGLE